MCTTNLYVVQVLHIVNNKQVVKVIWQ